MGEPSVGCLGFMAEKVDYIKYTRFANIFYPLRFRNLSCRVIELGVTRQIFVSSAAKSDSETDCVYDKTLENNFYGKKVSISCMKTA